MTSDAKIGLLLGLVFIFIIAFAGYLVAGCFFVFILGGLEKERL